MSQQRTGGVLNFHKGNWQSVNCYSEFAEIAQLIDKLKDEHYPLKKKAQQAKQNISELLKDI